MGFLKLIQNAVSLRLYIVNSFLFDPTVSNSTSLFGFGCNMSIVALTLTTIYYLTALLVSASVKLLWQYSVMRKDGKANID